MSEEIKNIQEELNEQMQIRRDKLAEYEADGIYPFGQRFVVKDNAKDIKDDFFLKYDGQPVVIAGRLMTIRSHGKTAFANMRDKSGDIQVYFRKDVLGEDAYKYVKMLDIDIYMRIAPELYLKRLIVGGMDRVFEMNRCFRNEGIDNRHNPEFTTIESYQAYGDVEDAIRLTENLVSYCAQEVLGTQEITYQGTEINLTPPWNRITMAEGVKKYTGEDFDAVTTVEEARAIADRLNVEYTENDGIGKILNLCFEDYVEENLIQPTIVYGHPKEISPLAKASRENPLATERFEAFIYGRELANGFSELNDPIDQKQRFLDQLKEREAGDDEAHRMDEDFVTALEYGLPPTAGLGVGIDRLVMFLTDSASIRDVLLFPLMKPEAPKHIEAEEEAAE